MLILIQNKKQKKILKTRVNIFFNKEKIKILLIVPNNIKIIFFQNLIIEKKIKKIIFSAIGFDAMDYFFLEPKIEKIIKNYIWEIKNKKNFFFPINEEKKNKKNSIFSIIIQ